MITIMDAMKTTATVLISTDSDLPVPNAARMTNDSVKNAGIRNVDAIPTASQHLRKAWLIESETNIRAPD